MKWLYDPYLSLAEKEYEWCNDKNTSFWLVRCYDYLAFSSSALLDLRLLDGLFGVVAAGVVSAGVFGVFAAEAEDVGVFDVFSVLGVERGCSFWYNQNQYFIQLIEHWHESRIQLLKSLNDTEYGSNFYMWSVSHRAGSKSLGDAQHWY